MFYNMPQLGLKVLTKKSQLGHPQLGWSRAPNPWPAEMWVYSIWGFQFSDFWTWIGPDWSKFWSKKISSWNDIKSAKKCTKWSDNIQHVKIHKIFQKLHRNIKSDLRTNTRQVQKWDFALLHSFPGHEINRTEGNNSNPHRISAAAEKLQVPVMRFTPRIEKCEMLNSKYVSRMSPE